MPSTLILLLTGVATASGVSCEDRVKDLNARFQNSSDCERPAGKSSYLCSGVLLTVRSSFAPGAQNERQACPTTAELLTANATSGCFFDKTSDAALWCPYACNLWQDNPLDDMQDGHLSASFIRSDLPGRRLWSGLDGVGLVYDSEMLADATYQDRSLILSVFPADGGTANQPGCGAFSHAQLENFTRRGCFLKPAIADDTNYTSLSEIPAAWPEEFTDAMRKARCVDKAHFDMDPTCVIDEDQFDSIFAVESKETPPRKCENYNELAVQTTAGLPHAQQPIAAFFYKVNDPYAGPESGCPEQIVNASALLKEAMFDQAILFQTLTGIDKAPAIGIDMSDQAWLIDKAPFFCESESSVRRQAAAARTTAAVRAPVARQAMQVAAEVAEMPAFDALADPQRCSAACTTNISYIECTDAADCKSFEPMTLADSSSLSFDVLENKTIADITQTAWNVPYTFEGQTFDRYAWLYTLSTTRMQSSSTCVLYFQAQGETQLSPGRNDPRQFAMHADVLYTIAKRVPLVLLEVMGNDPAEPYDLQNEWQLYPDDEETEAVKPPYRFTSKYSWKAPLSKKLGQWYLQTVLSLVEQQGVDCTNAVLMGYSTGAEMVSRAIESFPSMATFSGAPFPLVMGAAFLGGGSMYCYAYADDAELPGAFVPCVDENKGCCPHGATEVSYMNGARPYGKHPPSLLVQGDGDFNADANASVNYYSSLASSGGRGCIVRLHDNWHGIRHSNTCALELFTAAVLGMLNGTGA